MPPSTRNIRIAGALVLAVGLAASAVAIFSEQLGLGAEAARGTFGWKRASLLAVGGLMFAAGALLVALPQAVTTRWKRIRGYGQALLCPSDRHLRSLAIALLALLGLTLLWTRLAHIGQSFWHDEVVTVLNYSGVGPAAILLGDSPFSINNHVAYNLLSWATTAVLGESEAVYRLWSVLPGIAAVGVGAWWAWGRIGPLAAVAFATIAVAGPLHLEWIPQARGYGIAVLAATLMLVAADRLTHAYSRPRILGFLGAGLVGIWTLSIFAIAFVGQALALLRWRHLRLAVVGAVLAAGALSVLFYAPVVADMLSPDHREPSGVPIPLSAALALDRPLEWLVIPTVTMLTGEGGRAPITGSGVAPDAPWTTWLDVAVLGLLVLGLVALWRRGDGGLALILVAPPLFFNLAFSLGDLNTVTRHQLFLLPYVVMLVATGIAELGRIAARRGALKGVAVGVGVAATLMLVAVTVAREQRKDLPRENFQGVANVIDRASPETVVTDSLRSEGLLYYVGGDLIVVPSDDLEPVLCESEQELAYIDHLLTSDPYWSPAVLDCLAGRSLARVHVPQRARGGGIDVWMIGPEGVRRP